MKVDMPNEEQIKSEIENIILQGLDPKESFYSCLKNIYRQIGIKYLFHDGIEIIFIVLLVSSILFLVMEGNNMYYMQNTEAIYVYIFIASPILYLAMSILSFINAKQNKTYEVEMTCKYNIYQISAFRMLVFSIICILFNTLFIAGVMYFYENINYLKALIISVASLFLFSAIFLLTVTKIKNRHIKHFTVLGWVGFNLALYILKMDFYIKLINNISTYIWFIVAIGSILVYIKNLKILIVFRNREGMV